MVQCIRWYFRGDSRLRSVGVCSCESFAKQRLAPIGQASFAAAARHFLPLCAGVASPALLVIAFRAGLRAIALRDQIVCISARKFQPDVGEHGAADDQGRDDECGQDASPEADAVEGNKKCALLAGQGEPRCSGQHGPDSHRNQKPAGPDEGDSECELQSLIHDRSSDT